MLWALWLTYGSFYFCRNNLGVALPGLQKELGYTSVQVGAILMWLKLAYGIGQFINGQLADRFSARKLLAVGLLASAGLNVVFGWGTALYFLTFVWACNGYVQALGWPSTMRVAANWFPVMQRGKALGIIGTGYQLCGALTFVVAGWAAQSFGWRAALYVPAALLVASAIHMLCVLDESPPSSLESARATGGEAAAPGRVQPPAKLGAHLAITLTNPAIWLTALGLYLLDACRYGFTDWGVKHLKEVSGAALDVTAYKYAVLPLGGMAGAYLAGWATDRFFGSRRPPVICALLVSLGLLSLVYNRVVHWGHWASIIILFAIGFCIFGAQVMLVGTLPIDLAKPGTAAAAVGFVNFMGYMGAASGDYLTGYISEHHGWHAAVYFWSACAWLGAITVSFLWNARHKGEPTELMVGADQPR